MHVFSILLIIFGALIAIISFLIFSSARMVTKNDEAWQNFYNEASDAGFPQSEEEMYQMISRIGFWSGIFLVIGNITLFGGIIINILAK